MVLVYAYGHDVIINSILFLLSKYPGLDNLLSKIYLIIFSYQIWYPVIGIANLYRDKQVIQIRIAGQD